MDWTSTKYSKTPERISKTGLPEHYAGNNQQKQLNFPNQNQYLPIRSMDHLDDDQEIGISE